MAGKNTKDRRLTLRIDGPLAREGKVPVELLTSKLKSAQRLLNSVGSAIAGGGSTGKYKDSVSRTCRLDFVTASKKCLEVVMEIPPFEELFEEDDIGLQALEQFSDTLKAAKTKDRKKIESLYPDRGQRTRVLRAAYEMFPDEESGYEVSMQSNGKLHELTPDIGQFLLEVSQPPEPDYFSESIRTLTGVLYLIKVKRSPQQIGIIVDNRQITCYFPPELEALVEDLIPGSLIEVEGKVTLNDIGKINEVDEVLDARQVQLVPLFWSRLIFGNMKFEFSERLLIIVDFNNGIWSHENEPLGILGYG